MQSSEFFQTKADGIVCHSDLGLHLDGYISVCGHSLIIGATPEKPATGPKADALLAAHKACEAAARLIKPGNEVRLDIELSLSRRVLAQ